MRLCINNADARLPNCTPLALQSLQVRHPKWNSSDAADVANLAVLEAQAGSGPGGFGVDVIRGNGQVMPGMPNATANLCSDPLPLVVPLRQTASGKWLHGTRSINLRAVMTAARTDTDTLILRCHPSTCGNGIVETNHEECDDGNRTNGDGCNQACQLE